jgi:hypothetical protein
MLLILLYLLFLFIFYLFVAPLKKEVAERFIDKPEVKIYGSGLMIPETAYKADTNKDDQLGFDIYGKIKNSKATNVNQLYNELGNDNYDLFSKKYNVVPTNAFKKDLFPRTDYNPANETKYIFSTGLPK